MGEAQMCTRGAVIKCRLTAAPLPGALCMLQGGDKGCVAPKSVGDRLAVEPSRECRVEGSMSPLRESKGRCEAT
jgi:hypothetical protein